LTPLSLEPRESSESSLWYAENSSDLYPAWDLPITSAARLSATFPWISPIARPAVGTVDDRIAYHLADGGYFDNHGVATAVDFLRTVKRELAPAIRELAPAIEENPDDRPRRVRLKILLIQIRAAEITARESLCSRCAPPPRWRAMRSSSNYCVSRDPRRSNSTPRSSTSAPRARCPRT
jgi:hypothetical protein